MSLFGKGKKLKRPEPPEVDDTVIEEGAGIIFLLDQAFQPNDRPANPPTIITDPHQLWSGGQN